MNAGTAWIAATNSGFNDNPACFVEAPELARSEQGMMWLVFGEKCTAGNWHVVLRRLE